MEASLDIYLEKCVYVYRRSCKDFSNLNSVLFFLKSCFGASSLTAFAFLPLAGLSLGVVVVEIIEKSLNVNEKKEVYKIAFKFYKELLLKYKAGKITMEEV